LLVAGMSLKNACKEVGISPQSFHADMAAGNKAVSALLDDIKAQERIEVQQILVARIAGITQLLESIANRELAPRTLLQAMKYLDKRQEVVEKSLELVQEHGGETIKDLAPVLSPADSRIGRRTIQVRATDSGVEIDLPPALDNIIEGDFTS